MPLFFDNVQRGWLEYGISPTHPGPLFPPLPLSRCGGGWSGSLGLLPLDRALSRSGCDALPSELLCLPFLAFLFSLGDLFLPSRGDLLGDFFLPSSDLLLLSFLLWLLDRDFFFLFLSFLVWCSSLPSSWASTRPVGLWSLVLSASSTFTGVAGGLRLSGGWAASTLVLSSMELEVELAEEQVEEVLERQIEETSRSQAGSWSS